jgi:hypothetical protein
VLLRRLSGNKQTIKMAARCLKGYHKPQDPVCSGMSVESYRPFVSCWPVKNLADMAERCAAQVCWQGEDICFVSFRQSCIAIAVPITGC